MSDVVQVKLTEVFRGRASTGNNGMRGTGKTTTQTLSLIMKNGSSLDLDSVDLGYTRAGGVALGGITGLQPLGEQLASFLRVNFYYVYPGMKNAPPNQPGGIAG